MNYDVILQYGFKDLSNIKLVVIDALVSVQTTSLEPLLGSS